MWGPGPTLLEIDVAYRVQITYNKQSYRGAETHKFTNTMKRAIPNVYLRQLYLKTYNLWSLERLRPNYPAIGVSG